MAINTLSVAQVYRHCPLKQLDFEDTSSLTPLDLLSAHGRAADALNFGTDIRNGGYNLYVLGEPGAGKHEMISRFLRRRAESAQAPRDWCYVFNFDDPARPRHLSLPAGQGRELRKDFEQLIEDLRSGIPAVFESEEYQNRVQELEQAAQLKQRSGLEAVRKEAAEQGVLMLTTPGGFTFAPAKGDSIMEPEEFNKLPEEERLRIDELLVKLQRKLQQTIQQMPRLARELRRQVTGLNEEMILTAIGGPLQELSERHVALTAVIAHLDAIRRFIVEHVNVFQQESPDIPPEAIFSRCRINLLVDNADCEGAPVIFQDLPTHQHLVGRIEHHVRDGALLTDFSLIRAGALHRANGGYLILDVRNVLMQPAAWETLKRILHAGEIRTESLEQAYGLISTVSLEPEPIPLDVKIVLLGDRLFYYLLSVYDPDFLELFKVQVDLEDEFRRDDRSHQLFARMLATLVNDADLLPLTADGVAAVIEQASRWAGDQNKVVAGTRQIGELLREAAYWAGKQHVTRIERSHVDKAVAEQVHRAERLRERLLEQIHVGTVMIASSGQRVAQINGLSLLQLGNFSFGQPTRISATARPGRGQVVDIEREAKTGGPIHSKAMMILSRYLASRYAPESELSLSASIAFEQSYGGIEGDSASVAELCVLVSAISGLALRQDLAVTGSINQHGEVQAIGAVNEKIEGFFRVCRDAGGLSQHGVVIPAANLRHLMLSLEVREAMTAGRFHVHAIEHVDDALTLFTGLPAGSLDDEGKWTAGSVNARVAERLLHFSQVLRRSRAASLDAAGEASDNGER